MFIIDGDTHLTEKQERGVIQSAEDLLANMQRSGVDKSISWLVPPYIPDVEEGNRYVYQATKRYPDQILGFGWADPNLGVQKAKDMVKKCIYDYGFYGVKLNGAQNNFYIDSPERSIPVIEEIAKTGKLLAFHVGADAYEQTHPFRVAKIAKQFPELKILMVHMGGVRKPDLSNAALEFAEECPNITLIGSGISSKPILKAIKSLGADRVCFGSDSPFELMHVEVAKYEALLDGEVSSEEKALVMGGNLVKLFELG